MKVQARPYSRREALSLVREGVPPLLARLWASRKVSRKEDAVPGLAQLLPYSALLGAEAMAVVLADGISAGKRFLVVADYDCDGATACAIAVLGLRAYGAKVDYVIPDRKEHGYGLTPGIVDIALAQGPRPDYLITVDNGIAANQGVAHANQLGVPVLVTDHHLPGDTPPDALVIVNPSQHGCAFESKALAGCGVMYYVLWALQDLLVERGYVGIRPGFDITQLLPIVAIGTIADVVPLDLNNRVLVAEGLSRIHAGCGLPGIDALARAAGRDPAKLATSDVAFGIGPRINAAGRLESMNVGVECLLAETPEEAGRLASQLHDINEKRKEIEADMTEEATRVLLTDVRPDRFTAVLHAQGWHVGVIGIVAGRIKERIWRPTFVLADGKDGELKGSGRSIPGFHLRDALDLVDRRCPGVLVKFGGHAMAAGVTVAAGRLAQFQDAFEQVAREKLTESDLLQVLMTDGPLALDEYSLESVALLRQQVWGQLFPEPLFSDDFRVLETKALSGGKHLKLTVEKNGRSFEAVKFRHSDGAPAGTVRLAFRLDANTYREETRLQLLVEHIEEST